MDNILSEASKEREEVLRWAQGDRTRAEVFINKEWDRILSSINRAASKHIPSKFSKTSREEKDKEVMRNPRFKDIKNLKRIVKRMRNSIPSEEGEVNRFLWNVQIQEINNRQETQIKEIEFEKGEEWVQDMKN